MESLLIWPFLFWVLFPIVYFGNKLLASIGRNVVSDDTPSTSGSGRRLNVSVILRWLCLSHSAYGAGLVAFALATLALEVTIGVAGALSYWAIVPARAFAYVFATEYVAVALAPSNKRCVALAILGNLMIVAGIAALEQSAAANYRGAVSSLFAVIIGGWRLWANVRGQDITSFGETRAVDADE